MNVDYLKLQERMDERVVHLKRFAGQLEKLKEGIPLLEEFQGELEDLFICYNELDEEAKKGVSPMVCMILDTYRLRDKLKHFLGDENKDVNIGFRHLFKD